jgi:hypothetical protein
MASGKLAIDHNPLLERDYSMGKSDFSIWLAVNEDGDAAVSMDGPAEARDALVDDYGGAAIRTVKLAVTMTLPEIEDAEVDVPDDAGELEVEPA